MLFPLRSHNFDEVSSPLETVSSAFTIPADRRVIQPILLTGNASITLPASSSVASGSQYYTLIVEIRQDSTGNRSVTWVPQGSDTLKWLASTTAHPINTNPNAISRVQFLYRGGVSRIDAAVIWVD